LGERRVSPLCNSSRMQPFPVQYEPDPFKPCLSIRSRREQNTRETVNARHVEQWLSDGPSFRGGSSLDTHGLSSRLYRENIDTHPQFSTDLRTGSELTEKVTLTLAKIQKIEAYIRTLSAGPTMDAAVKSLKEEYGLYKAIVEAQKGELIDSFGKNPYFDKFSAANDSRNMARELRSVVYEDVADRGVSESKKLLERSFESRFTEKVGAGPNPVEAFELLRPSINKMNKVYNF
jgi:hypothetical protein